MQRKPGKKYNASKEMIDKLKSYTLEEAVALAKKVSYTKFTATLELHIKTFADPKYNDQMVRGTVVLPHGTGKTVRVAAFVGDDKIEEAQKAGADVVGNQSIIRDVEAGKIDFDVLVTTNDMMRDLAKIAKTLGPKGLMPNPKAGTVTNDLVSSISEIKKGRVEFKLDKTGNIHVGVGKLDFSDDKLIENITSLLKAIEEAKPTGIKGKLMKKVVIAPTMGPGINIAY